MTLSEYVRRSAIDKSQGRWDRPCEYGGGGLWTPSERHVRSARQYGCGFRRHDQFGIVQHADNRYWNGNHQFRRPGRAFSDDGCSSDGRPENHGRIPRLRPMGRPRTMSIRRPLPTRPLPFEYHLRPVPDPRSHLNAALTITGAANNGSGLIRLTVASTATFATSRISPRLSRMSRVRRKPTIPGLLPLSMPRTSICRARLCECLCIRWYNWGRLGKN